MNPKMKRALIVGLGGGVVPTWFEKQGVSMDVVDIDPDIVDYAKNFFSLKIRGDIFIEDARSYLQRCNATYDLIILDVFSSDAAPSHILSTEALSTLKTRLHPEGMVAINYIGRWGDDAFVTQSLLKTLSIHFKHIQIFPCFTPNPGEIGNLEIVAYNGGEKPIDRSILARIPVHPLAQEQFALALRHQTSPPANKKGIILTDEYNPFDCYDHGVNEAIRKGIVQSIPWEVLL